MGLDQQKPSLMLVSVNYNFLPFGVFFGAPFGDHYVSHVCSVPVPKSRRKGRKKP